MFSFHTTLWTRLHEAAAGQPTAFDELALRYRAPLLAFLRHQGLQADQAEDIVQDVFLRLLERDVLQRADAERGRFRSYLLRITLNLLSEARKRDNALKRGGGQTRVPLEGLGAAAAEDQFAAVWLQELMRVALETVQTERPTDYELLNFTIQGMTPAQIAERTGRSPGALRVALHKARKRLAEALRAEVARYCSSEEEFADEMRAFEPYIG